MRAHSGTACKSSERGCPMALLLFPDSLVPIVVASNASAADTVDFDAEGAAQNLDVPCFASISPPASKGV